MPMAPYVCYRGEPFQPFLQIVFERIAVLNRQTDFMTRERKTETAWIKKRRCKSKKECKSRKCFNPLCFLL